MVRRRADARQHADGRADEHADEAPHEIDRRQRDGEALREEIDGVHQSSPSTRPVPIL